FPSNTQTKTLAWRALITARAVKSFEDLVGALLWNRLPLVCHRQLYLPIACLRYQANAAVALAILDRIVDQVLDNQANREWVTHNRQMIGYLRLNLDPCGFSEGASVVACAIENFAQVELPALQVEASRVRPCE